jgi:hypothetical protein
LDTSASTVNGSLSKDVISSVVRRQYGRIRACYERALLANPALTATVTTRFVIDRSGKVTTASASGADARISACVGAVFRGLRFPAPNGGGVVSAVYPIRFAPG